MQETLEKFAYFSKLNLLVNEVDKIRCPWLSVDCSKPAAVTRTRDICHVSDSWWHSAMTVNLGYVYISCVRNLMVKRGATEEGKWNS